MTREQAEIEAFYANTRSSERRELSWVRTNRISGV